MKPMPNLTETELETFGASVVEDFTWKQLLDTDACTMCGRCTSVCPAHATGKPLDPREIVLKTGEVMAATGTPGRVAADRHRPRDHDRRPTRCSSGSPPRRSGRARRCKACDEICPVNIEILDKILDMRRYLSLMESQLPDRARQRLPGDGEPGQPVGHEPGRARRLGQRARRRRRSSTRASRSQAEYLYWVGCAGSFDDKNKKVTQAMAKLLRRAGIDVAILGPSEMCTGDSARRSGNEYLFQMLAMPNIEMLNGMGVKKIITQCPHCFNTLLNEYPQLGGNYEVIHHTPAARAADRRAASSTSARRRSRSGSRTTTPATSAATTTCTSRRARSSARSRASRSSRCRATAPRACAAAPAGRGCGWRSPSAPRSTTSGPREAISTGATRVATACPFCYIMLDDGVKARRRRGGPGQGRRHRRSTCSTRSRPASARAAVLDAPLAATD